MWSRVAVLLAASAVLALGRAALQPDGRLEVQVEPGQSLDEAILIDQGLRSDWVHTDPVIRRRLVQNLRFAGREGTDRELVEQALELGMARTDPVARERLVQRASEALGQVAEPTEEELRLYLARNPDPFRIRAVHSFHQQPLGPHGEARSIAALPELQRASTAQVAGRFGAEFARGVAEMQPGQTRELASAYGRHRVYLVGRELDRIPTLEEVRPAVVQAVLDAKRPEAATRRMELLRARYRVRP